MPLMVFFRCNKNKYINVSALPRKNMETIARSILCKETVRSICLVKIAIATPIK